MVAKHVRRADLEERERSNAQVAGSLVRNLVGDRESPMRWAATTAMESVRCQIRPAHSRRMAALLVLGALNVTAGSEKRRNQMGRRSNTPRLSSPYRSTLLQIHHSTGRPSDHYSAATESRSPRAFSTLADHRGRWQEAGHRGADRADQGVD